MNIGKSKKECIEEISDDIWGGVSQMLNPSVSCSLYNMITNNVLETIWKSVQAVSLYNNNTI
jgi:hypothetical protein